MGTYYKSSSTKFIRASTKQAFVHYLRPRFFEANEVLDTFVRNLRKTRKTAGVVHKRAISTEQLMKLFESSEQSDWPTAWTLPSHRGRLGSTLASFLEDGDVKTSDSWHRRGFEYYELNRSQHQGTLADHGLRWIGCEDIYLPGIWKVPSKKRSRATWDIADALFQRPRDGQSKKFNPADDKIWFWSAPLVKASRHKLNHISQTTASEPHLLVFSARP